MSSVAGEFSVPPLRMGSGTSREPPSDSPLGCILRTWKKIDPENLKKYSFSGRRTARGLYKTKSGKLLNADVNGALNILRKSKVVDLSILYYRGDVDTPVRIRIA